MHGWFLPALGLALLGGAGVALERSFHWPLPALLALVLFLACDLVLFNSVQNCRTFARDTAEHLYLAPLSAFIAALQATSPKVERLAAPIFIGRLSQSRPPESPGDLRLQPARADPLRRLHPGRPGQPAPVRRPGRTHWLDGDGSLKPQPTLTVGFVRAHPTWLPDPAATRAALDDFDPAAETLALGPPQAAENDPSATVQVTERADDHLALHYRSSTPNLVRLALPMYPGWRATREGNQDLPIVTVDHALIGIVVPPGEGDVRVWYAPRYFWPAAAISALAVLLTLAVLAGVATRFAGTRSRRPDGVSTTSRVRRSASTRTATPRSDPCSTRATAPGCHACTARRFASNRARRDWRAWSATTLAADAASFSSPRPRSSGSRSLGS
jgi:hypothetical protein